MLFENLIRRVNNIKDRSDSYDLFLIFQGLYRSLNTQFTTTAGLRIGTTATLVRTGAAAAQVVINGKLLTVDAAEDMPALVGTVTNAAFNIFVFTMDEAGTFYTQMGTEGASIDEVLWPTLHAERAIVGYVIINPTGTGNFVGGTTDLNDGTVTPNAVYVSPTGAFRPDAVIGA